MSKRYRLLKEIVDPRWGYPKGSVFSKTGVGENGAYTCGNFSLHPDAVENNSEWFELISDIPEQTTKEGFVWTDELVKEFICELLWINNIHGERPKDFSDGKNKSDELMKKFKESKSNIEKKAHIYHPTTENNFDLSALENVDLGISCPPDLNGLIQKAKDDAVKNKQYELAVMISKIETLISQSNTPKEEQGAVKITIGENDYFSDKGVYDKLKSMPTFSAPKEEQPTKERIELWDICFSHSNNKNVHHYNLASKELIPEEKFPLIKSAIENILNNK